MNSPFYTRLLGIGSFLGALGVIFGAFGAHFIKSRLAVSDLDTIRTGVFYLFIHVTTILVVVLLARNDANSRILRSSGIFFVTGVILFSGSLFIIATQAFTGLNGSYIGVLTPIGGLCFIIGWALIFIYAFSKRI